MWESRTHGEKGKEFLLAGAVGELWERRLEGWGYRAKQVGEQKACTGPARGHLPREEAAASPNHEVLPRSHLEGDKEEAGVSEGYRGSLAAIVKMRRGG